ncbi:MAG: MarR family winged helix-turn-helix transcriptional regulator [Protaetiibacter sp.]
MSDAPRAGISPVVTLLALSAEWEARLDRELRELGLTTRKYGLLAHVDVTPGISFSELARRSRITVQSAHAAVRSLVDAGLVADANAHAGAASVLRVTEAGSRVLAAAEALLGRLDAELRAEAPSLSVVLTTPHEGTVSGGPDD